MFGERPQTQVQDDPAGIRAQIRRAMVETSDLSGRHLDVVTRICMLLQQKIDEAADTIVKKTENLGPVGFLTDAEAIGMESCITNMRIMTRVFQSDVNAGEPGAFFEVVAANLRRGRPYQYLLYGDREYWRTEVETFRRLVTKSGVPVELPQENLQLSPKMVRGLTSPSSVRTHRVE